MESKMLKSGLFGYSKTSVCEYIAQVNKEFSDKLYAASAESREEKKELKEQIARLEAELAQYKRLYDDISAALLDAQQYAERLKADAEAENRRQIAENTKYNDEQNRRISDYRSEIDQIRRQLAHFAADTDQKLQGYLDEMDAVQAKYQAQESKEV